MLSKKQQTHCKRCLQIDWIEKNGNCWEWTLTLSLVTEIQLAQPLSKFYLNFSYLLFQLSLSHRVHLASLPFQNLWSRFINHVLLKTLRPKSFNFSFESWNFDEAWMVVFRLFQLNKVPIWNISDTGKLIEQSTLKHPELLKWRWERQWKTRNPHILCRL